MSHRAVIEIVPYDETWPASFARERAELLEVFSPVAVEIEHVGSTAVPGLGAKPIVDMMLGADRIAEVEARISRLEEHGYQYMPEHESVLPERRFFAKPRQRPRRFHLHAVELASEFWQRHLLFRDFLRRNPAVAAEYYALKLRLATRFGDDREGYTEAKTSFIEAVVRSAGGSRLPQRR
jgi:GrpB-like predicted nucleotidyltransferase (UPF0157 family)